MGLAIPLTTLALIAIMVSQAYNGMADFDFDGSVEFVSASVEVESGISPNTPRLDK